MHHEGQAKAPWSLAQGPLSLATTTVHALLLEHYSGIVPSSSQQAWEVTLTNPIGQTKNQRGGAVAQGHMVGR